MARAGANVEFENDRVRVTRVFAAKRGRVGGAAFRQDRVVIYLRDTRLARVESGRREEIIRRAGDVVFRSGSSHEIEVLDDSPHEVLIVELKT